MGNRDKKFIIYMVLIMFLLFITPFVLEYFSPAYVEFDKKNGISYFIHKESGDTILIDTMARYENYRKVDDTDYNEGLYWGSIIFEKELFD